MGKLIIFLGPSGSGKSTMAAQCGLPELVTYTTRKPRQGEINGVTYHFIPVWRARLMRLFDLWAEYIFVFGNYYGTTKKQIEDVEMETQNFCAVLDKNGVSHYRKHMRDKPLVIGLRINMETAERRLRQRHIDNPDIFKHRLMEIQRELNEMTECDIIIDNPDGQWETTLATVKEFIAKNV